MLSNKTNVDATLVQEELQRPTHVATQDQTSLAYGFVFANHFKGKACYQAQLHDIVNAHCVCRRK